MKALAVAATVAVAGAAAPATPPPQIRHTTGFIEALAADGPIVAYDAQGDQPHGPACNRVYAWNLDSRRVTRASGRGTCDADASSTGAGVAQLAVAGRRLAWIANNGGNTESIDRLFTASLPEPHERRLAAVMRTGEIDCVMTGRALGGLVGRGAVLAYNIWTVVSADPTNPSSCATTTTSAALRRVGSRGTSLLRSGPDTLVAQAADGGRIAVAHTDGTVELFSANGSPLQTIGIEPPKELALAGDHLVVLTRTRRIDVYSVSTGRLGRAHAVPAGSEQLDAAAGVAAYAVGTKLHLLRLASGKDTVVASAPKRIAAVALSNRVVAYAYNAFKRTRKGSRDIGHVVVLRMPV